MITSPDNTQLKLIRRLARKRVRDAEGLFVAEGEDLVAAAESAGWSPELLLVKGEDVEPALLDAVSALGSGSRVVGVYRQRWSEPRGELCVYIHGVGDPGNVGTIIRSAHALADGPVILGRGCADPYGPKAVRASMGSIFASPPARLDREVWRICGPTDPEGAIPQRLVALDRCGEPLDAIAVRPPLTLCVGGERDGLPRELLDAATVASIPMRAGGPDSLNAAMAATIGMYELGNRMPRHG